LDARGIRVHTGRPKLWSLVVSQARLFRVGVKKKPPSLEGAFNGQENLTGGNRSVVLSGEDEVLLGNRAKADDTHQCDAVRPDIDQGVAPDLRERHAAPEVARVDT